MKKGEREKKSETESFAPDRLLNIKKKARMPSKQEKGDCRRVAQDQEVLGSIPSASNLVLESPLIWFVQRSPKDN